MIGKSKHEHKWYFLQTRTESEQVTPDTFKKVEYAYFVCNNCPDNGGQPEVTKVIVKNKEDQ